MKPRILCLLLLLLSLLLPAAGAGAAQAPADAVPAGYSPWADLEDILRKPWDFVSQPISVQGFILTALEEEGRFEYALSVRDRPHQVFVATYALAEGAPLLRPGDAVTVYGVFTGLAPFTGTEGLKEGAPIIQAAGILPLLPDSPARTLGTMDQPAPQGVPLTYPGDVYTDYASFEITVTDVIRGSDALMRARGMSKYNINPVRAQEYILVYLQVKALKVPGGRAPLDNGDFFFVSGAGSEYRQHFLINPPASFSPLYQDGVQEAVLSCLIQKADPRPLLVFQPQSQSPLWFDLSTP